MSLLYNHVIVSINYTTLSHVVMILTSPFSTIEGYQQKGALSGSQHLIKISFVSDFLNDFRGHRALCQKKGGKSPHWCGVLEFVLESC